MTIRQSDAGALGTFELFDLTPNLDQLAFRSIRGRV